VEVGTPAFELSSLVPNDRVRVDGDKEYVFKGIDLLGAVFVDPVRRRSFTTSYSPLVMSSTFDVVARTAFATRDAPPD